jgi:dTDP-4-dehydrorhamnose 3,5-epimerase
MVSSLMDPAEVFAENGDLRLVLPRCERGIGDVVRRPGDSNLIHGVRIEALSIWPDDRGYFLELHRLGTGLVADFPPTSQISAALSFPGTIKAFHYHLAQTDCWNPVRGMFQVALVDLRQGSPTFGRRNTMYTGDLNPWQILIPPGVAHGYKIVGRGDAILVYATDKVYNPADEGRIAHNDTSLNYDWETQHK